MQKIIRTYNSQKYNKDSQTDKLQELLDKGYIVVSSTAISDDYIEYILEKN